MNVAEATAGQSQVRRRDVAVGPEFSAGLVVAGLTVLVFVLRITQIHQSLLEDEIFTYRDIAHHSFSSVFSGVYSGGENSPPLFFLLAWLSAKLGDPTVWIRLPSIVFSTATVPVVYLLGRHAVGRAAGLVGAAIVTLSPFAVYYGVEARPYATMTFFVVLSTFALLKAVDERSAGWWVLYAVAAAGAAYSHYTSIFVLATQAVWSLWVCRDRLRGPLLANLLIVVLYVPWFPHVRGKSLNAIAKLEPFTISAVVKDVIRVIPGYPYASLRGIPTIVGLVALAICVAIGIAGAVWQHTHQSAGPRASSRLWLLVGLTAATPVGLFLYSILITDLWLARGLYASVPAAALVIGALLVRLPRPWAVATVAVTLVTLGAGALRAISPDYVRTPFRAMAAYLDKYAGPNDPVINDTPFGGPALLAQMKKPHAFMRPPLSIHAAPGGHLRAFVVQDEHVAKLFHIVGAPPVPHFQPIGHTHYQGVGATDLWVYRQAR